MSSRVRILGLAGSLVPENHEKPRREQFLEAAKAENSEFSVRVRSEDNKEAITAFFEKRPPDFTRTAKVAVAQRT
jgi:enoyl-CoA hydratase/carnithine racemase